MTKVTTRQTILGYLKRNHSVTSRELAGALKMTPANARHHLRILSNDGRIEVAQDRKTGRGRPEKVFQLSSSLVGENLSTLAEALLHIMEASQGISIEMLGSRLAGEVDLRDLSLIQRLKRTVERLNEMYYQAHWEAGAEGPRIILGHCPYLAILDRHPELCQMDTALLSKLSNEDVVQAQKRSQESRHCVFLMGK